MNLRGNPRALISLLTVLVIALLAGAVVLLAGPRTRTVSADFAQTVGLFEGSDVRVMGMRIGEVSKITPHGTYVRVDMTYDAKYSLPRDVKAVVIAPSVIADRFVQLTPGYVDGPVLASGALIREKDTRIPVELDTSLQVTNNLVTALGPQGANKNGALSGALATVAQMLNGNGAATRSALRNLASATDVIGAGAGNLDSTVKHLSGVSGTLAAYDAEVQRFNAELGTVGAALAGDSGQLSTLLATLARSLGDVATFIRDNRTALSTDVGRLASVTGALVTERQALIEVANIAPLAFTDLTETYDARAQAVRTRANFSEVARVVDQVICETLAKQAGPKIAPLCAALKKVFDQLPIRGGLGVPQPPTGVPGLPSAPADTSFSGLLVTLTGSL